VASDLSQWRCLVPSMVTAAHHNDLAEPVGCRRHQMRVTGKTAVITGTCPGT